MVDLPEHDTAFVFLTNVMNPLDVGVDLDAVHNAFTTCLDPVGDVLVPDARPRAWA